MAELWLRPGCTIEHEFVFPLLSCAPHVPEGRTAADMVVHTVANIPSVLAIYSLSTLMGLLWCLFFSPYGVFYLILDGSLTMFALAIVGVVFYGLVALYVLHLVARPSRYPERLHERR